MKILINIIIGILFTVASLQVTALSEKPQEANGQKAILVTGATSGIGLNLAKTLAKKGYYVYAGARKEKDIKRLNEIKNIQAVRLDVTVQADIDAAVDFIRKQERGLYGLVNNAGVTVFGPLIEVSEQDMQFQMDVNLFGPYRVTKAFAPLLIKSEGRIVNISSVAGTYTGALIGPYSMSKYAIEAFSESLASEMKKFNVGVSVIEPGNYNSKVIQSMKRRMKQNDTSSDSLFQAEMQQLFKYFTEDRSIHKNPDDVSNAITDALFSDKAKFRYLVTPNQGEAQGTIRKAVERVIQLNSKHQYSLDKEALIELLNNEINKSNGVD